MSLLKTEPTLLVEAVRALLMAAAAFGVAITSDQIDAVVAAVAAVLAVVVSTSLAAVNRASVYAPATVAELEAGDGDGALR